MEGKKTMGYEIAEQLEWQLPDVIIYPTGGGTGLIGMWNAFEEMEALGWIGSKRPRMVSIQASGYAPIVRAFAEGNKTAELWQDAKTVASGLRVPQSVADYSPSRTSAHEGLLLRHDTAGTAVLIGKINQAKLVCVPDQEIGGGQELGIQCEFCVPLEDVQLHRRERFRWGYGRQALWKTDKVLS